jgi:hypothetical protein
MAVAVMRPAHGVEAQVHRAGQSFALGHLEDEVDALQHIVEVEFAAAVRLHVHPHLDEHDVRIGRDAARAAPQDRCPQARYGDRPPRPP